MDIEIIQLRKRVKMRKIYCAVLNEINSIPIIPKKILDIGCGDGEFTQVVSTKFRDSDITAVDTSVPKSLTHNNIEFIKGNAEQLPFSDESFDLVFAVLSLHHWKDKEKGLKEMFRVLKRNGSLIIGDPLLENWMSNKFLGFIMQKLDGGVFTDRKSLSGYLSGNGFENIRICLIPNTIKTLYLITAKKN